MSQKTGIGKGGKGPHSSDPSWKGPPSESEDIIDPNFDESDLDSLGMEPEGEPFEPDPTGWEPTGKPEEIAGRKMHRMSPKDLLDLHEAHAGDAPMVNDPYKNLDIDERLTAEERRRLKEEERLVEQQLGEEEAIPEELLQKFSRRKRSRSQVEDAGSNSESATSDPSVAIDAGEVGEAVKVIEGLLDKARALEQQGDLKAAAELRAMATRIVNATKVKRVQEEQPRHPALAKLLNNFGLEKIEPASVSWLGIKWVFAARPEKVDMWVAQQVQADITDMNACLLAGSLVGMGVDEEGAPSPDPLWKVYNISLMVNYEVEADGEEGVASDTQPLKVQVYHKTCESCANEVPVQSEVCSICGALQDIFDVPLNLRLRYAQQTKRYFQEKLGLGSMELGVLVDEMGKHLKDRQLDREEIFPLAQSLFKQKKIPGSESGAES